MEIIIELRIHYKETNTYILDIVDTFKLHEQVMGPEVR